MQAQTRTYNRRYRGLHAGKDARQGAGLYGVFYPPNHLRIVGFGIDPEDGTRGVIMFDRNVAGAPGEIELWAGERKGFNPQIIEPRRCRVEFGGPLQGGSAWSFDPSAGSFMGADGCAEALAAGGSIDDGGGPLPAGKVWVTGLSPAGDDLLEFIFNVDVTLDVGQAAGYWCTDGGGNVMNGLSVEQPQPNVARVSFPSNLGSPGRAGLVAGFAGIVGAEVLAPVTWRF